MNTHTITVTYTNDDDDIHLECSCGWTKCLGFNPTASQIWPAVGQHFRETHRERHA